MDLINALKLSAESVSGRRSTAEADAPADPFSSILKSQQLQLNEGTDRAKALENFYEIHQRSQITGVPTAVYNSAIKTLGLDPVQDPFAGIRALQEAGFDTGAPSLAAILKYGAEPKAQGNQSYMAQGTATPKEDPPAMVSLAEIQPAEKAQTTDVAGQEPIILPDEVGITQEIQNLNEKYNNLLGPATNYYEAVSHLSKQINLTPYLNFTLSQALPMIKESLQLNETVWTAERWLQSKTADPT